MSFKDFTTSTCEASGLQIALILGIPLCLTKGRSRGLKGLIDGDVDEDLIEAMAATWIAGNDQIESATY